MLRALGLACTLAALVPAAAAQTDVFPNLWITDARVEGMAVLGDTVFVAGRFDYVGPPTGQVAVLDAQTGEADLSQPRFSALTSRAISAVLPDGAGGYYVAGQFSVVSGQVRRNLAHVLPDGTLNPAFQPVVLASGSDEFAGYVTALSLGAGVLYVGGRFDTVGGQARQNLAAVDAATGEVLPLQVTFAYPSSTSYVPRVEAVLLHEGVLYVGGIFEQVSGQPRRGLAALRAATGSVLPWRADLADENPGFFAYPDALALGTGTLYLGGEFDFVNGQRRFGPAEVTLADPATGEGGTPTSWAPDPSGPDNFYASDLVVVESFVYASRGTSGGALARIDRTTAAITFVAGGLGSARTLAYDPEGGPSGQGTLYVGAERRPTPSGNTFPVVFGVDPATGQPTGFDVMGATEGNAVRALAVEPGPSGRLLAGGDFVTLGAGLQRRNGLAAFSLTTGLPTAFGQGDFAGSEDLALSPDGRYLYAFANLVGGAVLSLTEFDLATGTTRSFGGQGLVPTPMSAEARADALRAAPPVLRSNPRVENATSAFVVTDDGAGGGRVCVSVAGVACYDRATTDLLFYTEFSTVTPQAENNGDLLYLPPGGPIVGPGGAGGTLFLAAPIERSGTQDLRRPALAAIDYATGDVIVSWAPGFAFAGAEGYSLALLDPDGADGPVPASLYAGGDRDWTVQGQTRQGLAAFDPATATLRPSWGATTSSGPALAMAAHRSPDGRGVIYAGGSFGFINGVRRACCVAAFDAVTGAYREDWQPISNIAFVLLASEQHQALFIGGFGGVLRGTGHVGINAVSPAAPILPTAVEAGGPEASLSASVALAGPNPFRSRTVLALSLPEAGPVEASLFDVLGRRVSVLHAGPLPAGTSRIDVDASTLPAGVYVARVSGPGVAASVTLTVVR